MKLRLHLLVLVIGFIVIVLSWRGTYQSLATGNSDRHEILQKSLIQTSVVRTSMATSQDPIPNSEISTLPKKSSPLPSPESQQIDSPIPIQQQALNAVKVAYPIVFINPEVVAKCAPEFQDGVREMASNFTAEVANSGVAPDSPEYPEVWKKAARHADQQFRALYGDDAARAMMMAP